MATSSPEVVLDCHHHSNTVDDDDQAHPRVTLEPSDYQLTDLSGSQTIDVNDSMDQLSTDMSYRPGSGGIDVSQFQNPSPRALRAKTNSAQSTPKMLRLPRIHALHPGGAFNGSRDSLMRNSIPLKETLKRTASHTPEVARPAQCFSLRRTKSASDSLRDDTRCGANFSICSDLTSSESLSLEAGTQTRKQYLGIPMDNLGEYKRTDISTLSYKQPQDIRFFTKCTRYEEFMLYPTNKHTSVGRHFA